MILYHFTALWGLGGQTGLAALDTSDGPDEIDARDFVASGSDDPCARRRKSFPSPMFRS
jgi:hypothetical protein